MYSLKLNAIPLLSITFALCDISSGARGADVAMLLICFNFIKSLSIFLMHLLCHQSIHHPWHFETLLCGLHKHMWDLTLTFETSLTAFRVIEYRRWFFISFACCRSNCYEMSLVGNVAFASIPLHISTSTFFYCHTKKANRKWTWTWKPKKTQQREERREAKKLDKTDASALFL